MVSIAIPAPRPAPEQPPPVPFQLPWSHAPITCRPVIGDALLLHYSLQKRSLRCMTELTVWRAREMLIAWAAEHRAMAGKREEVVRAALAAGVSKAEVHRLTGIARTTIDRIAGPAPGTKGERAK
jgi:hypothetical protein